jgi:hypothetical protein
MQKIFYFFNLWIAKTIPQLIAAGRAGGTAITTKFSERSTRVDTEASYISKIGKIAMKPTTAIKAIMATNFMPS